jgi:hypothetical protein
MLMAIIITHVCWPRTLPPNGYLNWYDWAYGEAGKDTDYWDRNTCQCGPPTTPAKSLTNGETNTKTAAETPALTDADTPSSNERGTSSASELETPADL